MTTWNPRANDLFMMALELPSAGERMEYLDRACVGDAPLRAEVESLLEASARAGRFLESPAPNLVATVDEGPIRESAGSVIGPYKLLEQIGEGGFGLVFMAQQLEPIHRKVALKVLKPGMDTRPVIARFEAERQALALMDHPHIAKVLDAGQTSSGRPYFVMDLVKGVPITEFCDQSQLTPRERLELFVHVCQAVQHAHQKGIIHRDLKPSNVLVTLQDGAPLVKVIDFGIAKALGQTLTDKTLFTGFAQMIGTPLYMSPEQAALSNVDVDTRSDIYSLGVLFYELLTGTTPFDKERLKQVGYDEMRRIIREEEPPKPSTRISTLGQSATPASANRKSDPRKLSQLFRGEPDWIVMKALEKDRNRRYETASAFAADVQRYLNDEPVQACPPSAVYRLRKFVRRNKPALTIAGLVLLIFMTVAGSVGWVIRDGAARQAENTRQVQEALTTAQILLAGNQVAQARQKLAEARSRIGDDRARFGSVADEVETMDAELGRFEDFLHLVEQAHEEEVPQAVSGILPADSAGGTEAGPRRARHFRDPAKAVPFLLHALSSYGVLEHEDWSDQLERSLLERDQIARVHRTAYEELLWLADNVVVWREDHRSGRSMSPEESARQGLAYLHQAEIAACAIFKSPTAAFYQIRGRCRRLLGEEGEARKDDAQARQMRGAIAFDHFLLGVAAFDAGKKTEAVQQFEAALRVEPTHYWSLLLLGACLCNLGQQERDFEAAATAFTGCIMQRPTHAHGYYNRGNAYQKLRRTKDAVADFQEALRLRPDFPEAYHNLGDVLIDEGKPAEAEAEFREALRLRPFDDQPHEGLGRALKAQGKLVEAEAEYREALRLRPGSPEVHTNLGIVLRAQRKLAEAEAEYREALRLRPDFPEAHKAHSNLANALADQGKLAEAEGEFREALRLRPGDPLAHFGLGNTLHMQGKLAEAVTEYWEAVRLRPDYPEAHNNLGNSLHRQGKPAEAEAAYREAIRLRPDYLEPRYSLGIALGDQGKLVEAEAAYRETIGLQPDFPEAHCNLGHTLRQQGRFGEALAALRRGHELGSRRPGWAYPSAKWLGQTEQLVALDAKLTKVLNGEAQPADPTERIELAKLCQEYKKLNAAAARFYAEAFAAVPKLAGNLRTQDRYNAACTAALAGRGEGADAPKLDEKERARLRRQALEWLRADLTAWGQLLEKDHARATVQQALRHWQKDTDLAGVRGDALSKWPEAERRAWRQLWADVEQTLMKVNPKNPKGTKQKSAN